MIDLTFKNGFIVTANGSVVWLTDLIPDIDNESKYPEIYKHFAHHENHHENIMTTINNAKIYDPYLKGKSDLTILDLGANIGIFSLYAQSVASRIVAVEPTPSYVRIFKTLLAKFPHVQVVEAAMFNYYGLEVLGICHGNPTMNSLENKYDEQISVRTITLDHLLKYNFMHIGTIGHVDFCKVDIEGSEFKALDLSILNACKDIIKSYYIEVHNAYGMNGLQMGEAIMANLRAAGYSAGIVRECTIYAERN